MLSNELDFSEENVSKSWMEVNRMLGEDFGEGSRWLYVSWTPETVRQRIVYDWERTS